MKQKPQDKTDKSYGETKCYAYGSKVETIGSNAGQCTNKKCKTEHTHINILVDDETLTDCQYKDFYG